MLKTISLRRSSRGDVSTNEKTIKRQVDGTSPMRAMDQAATFLVLHYYYCWFLRPHTKDEEEHKAYFAVLAVLFQPAACQEASRETLTVRRGILKRLKIELHIPDLVSDAVEGALKGDNPQNWQKSLAALSNKVKTNLPDHAPLMLGNLELRPGTDVDVKDYDNNWLPGKISGLQGSSLCIHYHGWAPKWDEWVDVSQGRVAPRETYTSKAAWSRRKHPGKQRV